MKLEILVNNITGWFGELPLDTEDGFAEDCNIQTLQTHNDQLDGIVEVCEFEEYHSLFSIDAQLHKQLELVFDAAESENLLHCFVFNSAEEFSLKQDGFNYTYAIERGKFAYLQLVAGAKVNISFCSNCNAKASFLILGNKIVKDKYKCDVNNLPSAIKSDEKKSKRPNRSDMGITLRELTNRIYLREAQGIEKRVQYEGLCYEIFAQSISDIRRKNQSGKLKLKSDEKQKLLEAAEIIEANFKNPKGQKEIAKNVGLNINKLTKGFKLQYGMTLNEYSTNFRMNKAKSLLIQNELNVCQVAEEVGYLSASYFSKKFKEVHGVLPSDCDK